MKPKKTSKFAEMVRKGMLEKSRKTSFQSKIENAINQVESIEIIKWYPKAGAVPLARIKIQGEELSFIRERLCQLDNRRFGASYALQVKFLTGLTYRDELICRGSLFNRFKGACLLYGQLN